MRRVIGGFALAGLSTLAIASSGCTSKTDKPIEPAITESDDTASVVLIFMGFHSEPHTHQTLAETGFDPRPIGYLGVDVVSAHEAFDTAAMASGFDVIDPEPFIQDVIDTTEADALWLGMKTMLHPIRDYLQTANPSCDRCSALDTRFVLQPNSAEVWTDNDRILFVGALESPSPINRGLRSGIGVFMFDGNGQFLNHRFIDYNFSNYDTASLAGDLVSAANLLD